MNLQWSPSQCIRRCWELTWSPRKLVLKLETWPIGSMYAIYGNIYHQYTPNVSIYTIHGSYGLWIWWKKKSMQGADHWTICVSSLSAIELSSYLWIRFRTDKKVSSDQHQSKPCCLLQWILPFIRDSVESDEDPNSQATHRMVHRQWFIDVYRISMVSQETFIDEMSLVSAQISMLKGWFFLKVIEHHRWTKHR